MNKRWQVIEDGYDVCIQDTVSQMNFATLSWGMMGVRTSSREIAQKICDWLNTTDIELKP